MDGKVTSLMGAWQDKFVIGLTGNIATGKSVIRRMLAHLGAYGIDADSLVHRLMNSDGAGYEPVVEAFGLEIVSADGEINRSRLGMLVFSNPNHLKQLESILHPLVEGTIGRLMENLQEYIIVIEAIKLLEAGLGERCDSVWVADTPQKVQLERLVGNRHLTTKIANQRMEVQAAQSLKMAQADIVIHNENSLELLWEEVKAGWNAVIPVGLRPDPRVLRKQPLDMVRLHPDQGDLVNELLENFSEGQIHLNKYEIMESFSKNSFLMVLEEDRPKGLLAWNVENFIARIEHFSTAPAFRTKSGYEQMIKGIEILAGKFLCEVIMFPQIPGTELSGIKLEEMGYLPGSVNKFQKNAWIEAINSYNIDQTLIRYKSIQMDPLKLAIRT